jgi:methionyl-tRNA synthetase
LEPYIPFTAAKIREIINFKFADTPNKWNQAGKLIFETGQAVNSPEILINKIDDKLIDQQISKLMGNNSKASSPSSNDLISINDFKKIDLKVAEIIKAEKIPKTNKLLKLRIKLEKEERQIVAGIAKNYNVEDLVGKQIVVVVNLEAVKIRNEVSNGMLLAANDGENLSLVAPIDHIKTGSKVS